MAAFSRTLYQILDHLGYNDDMVKFRRETWSYTSELIGSYYFNHGQVNCITAGSKGEGLSSVLESDVDKMYLFKALLCISSEDQLPRMPQHHDTVFLADMVNVPPGYTRLKLHRPTSARNVGDRNIRDCLFESESGDVYLSSTFWANMVKGCSSTEDGLTYHEITGPSSPCSMGDTYHEDRVLGLSIHCPQFLQSWASRSRHHEWPSHDTVQTACSFLPQVVPVGAKGSDRQFQEWRFCFIESELTLIHSLNGTQNKLYILLKMIAKSILKPITGEISSYIMKNVTYWLSELLPMCVFIEEHLVSLVLLALGFLRMAIDQWDTLPYYMIPSRNLLSERLDDPTKRELSDVLSSLLQEGPQLFLRIEKLRLFLESASRTPNDVVKYGKMRDQVEKNILACFVFDILKKFNVHLDYSIKDKLMSSYINALVSHLNSSYPWRFGWFNAEEINKALRIVMS